MTKREQLAWAAGFLDGEGHFGVQKDRNILYISAGQTDRKVLDRLKTALEDGNIYGPYKQKNPNHKPYYYYKLTGNKRVEKALYRINPFLSGKKKEQIGRAIRKLATESVLKTAEVNSP